MSDSSKPEPVNLWERLTAYAREEPERMDGFLEMASRGAALGGQELSLGVSETGWTIKVFTCYGTMETVIRIPADGSPPSLEQKDGEFHRSSDTPDCEGCATCIPLRAELERSREETR